MLNPMNRFPLALVLSTAAVFVLALAPLARGEEDALAFSTIEGAQRLNVVYILSDDHRYDVMGCAGHPWVETPAMDAMAKEGVYENYWEYNYPHTPTTFALRTPRYKFIQYHGIWDIDELYDLQTDPDEQHNLIFEKQHQPRITGMRADLHKILADSDAARVPFSHKRRMGSNLRLKSGSSPAEFPPQLMRE